MAVPTIHRCEFAECTTEWQTDNLETFLELYKIHVRAAHEDGAEARPSAKAERARRPEISSDVSDEDWNYFWRDGNLTKRPPSLKEKILSFN